METKRVCVVSALPMELPAGVRRSVKGKLPMVLDWHGGCFWGVTGVGARNVERFYRHVDAQGLVFSRVVVMGFGGALDDGVRCGEVVAVSSVVDREGGTYGLRVVEGFSAVVGLEVGQWTDAAGKRVLKGRFPEARFIDMESGAHARECAKRGWALSVLRVISDGAAERLPHFSYVAGSWWGLPWGRLVFHPVSFVHGALFSCRLWGYARRLGNEVQWLIREGRI